MVIRNRGVGGVSVRCLSCLCYSCERRWCWSQSAVGDGAIGVDSSVVSEPLVPLVLEHWAVRVRAVVVLEWWAAGIGAEGAVAVGY